MGSTTSVKQKATMDDMYATEDALHQVMNDDTMKAADTPHDTLHIRSTANQDGDNGGASGEVVQDDADEIFIDLRGNLTHKSDSTDG